MQQAMNAVVDDNKWAQDHWVQGPSYPRGNVGQLHTEAAVWR